VDARVQCLPVSTLAPPCSACGAAGWFAPCKLASMGWGGSSVGAGLPTSRQRLAVAEVLYTQGEPFTNLYAVRSGTLKSTVTLTAGREKICGFHTAGDVMALDAVAEDVHETTTTALEDAQVCVIAYAPLLAISARDAALQRRLNRLMSLEIARGQRRMLMLGMASARERLASFLGDMSQRFKAQGYSPRDFSLRMTREEIGNYLGLSVETVSRTFTVFRAQGLLDVQNRRVRIGDAEGFAHLGDLPAPLMDRHGGRDRVVRSAASDLRSRQSGR
jgi:CRP/FNR family transcriptional regulator